MKKGWKLEIPHLNGAGFTLIEVLVVAVILGVIGYMISDIIIRSLSGSQKTAVIGTTKQNGQIIIEAISQVIRNSDQVVCLDSSWAPAGGSGNVIVLYTQDGRYVRFRYTSINGNGTIAEDFPVVDFLINDSPYDVITALNSSHRICNPAPAPGIDITGQVLLSDTDVQNGVNIIQAAGSSDIFNVTRNPGSSDSVSIQFAVTQAVNASTGFQNTLFTPTEFRQTVQLR